MSLRAIILAAGVGARLGEGADKLPKALLRFGGSSLLERHIAILSACGIDEIIIGTGYRAAAIEAEIARISPAIAVRTVLNPDFTAGSVVTLASLAAPLAAGGDVVVMDADVLYDPRLMQRLLRSGHRNCLLLDREFEPGDEPVKICIRGGHIVDFRKQVGEGHDLLGESVGFFRFSGDVAGRLAGLAAGYVADGRGDEPYEEAIRDLLLAGPAAAFGYEDVTGLPWIEIDFSDDVSRAETEILPLLEPAGDPAP